MGRDSIRNKEYYRTVLDREEGTYDPCVHCSDASRVRGCRGLCVLCWKDRSVRHLYEYRVGTYYDDSAHDRPPPPAPCPHRPGSVGRLETLVWRRENGYGLWHPGDARDPADEEIGLPLSLLRSGSPKMLLDV